MQAPLYIFFVLYSAHWVPFRVSTHTGDKTTAEPDQCASQCTDVWGGRDAIWLGLVILPSARQRYQLLYLVVVEVLTAGNNVTILAGVFFVEDFNTQSSTEGEERKKNQRYIAGDINTFFFLFPDTKLSHKENEG